MTPNAGGGVPDPGEGTDRREALNAFIYVSEAMVAFDADDLRRLERKAQATNFALGVTGYLFYGGGRFLQYLEGETMAVEEVVARIRYDDRHRILTYLRSPIVNRHFPNWHMKWLVEEDLERLDRPATQEIEALRNCDESHPLEFTACRRMVDALSSRLT